MYARITHLIGIIGMLSAFLVHIPSCPCRADVLLCIDPGHGGTGADMYCNGGGHNNYNGSSGPGSVLSASRELTDPADAIHSSAATAGTSAIRICMFVLLLFHASG